MINIRSLECHMCNDGQVTKKRQIIMIKYKEIYTDKYIVVNIFIMLLYIITFFLILSITLQSKRIYVD